MRIPRVVFLIAPFCLPVAYGQSLPAAASSASLQAAATTTSSSSAAALTLDEALSLAEQNNPLLKEAAATVDRAAAGVQTSRAYKNPEAQFMAGNQSARSIATPGVPGTLWHYSASQTVEMPRERALRQKVSQLALLSSRHRSSGVRLSVLAEVKRAFYDVIRRKEKLVHAQENLALVEDLRRRVRLEVEVGEKGKLELTRAEAELARADAAVRSADVELSNTRAILKAMIGLSSEEPVDATGALREVVQLPPLPDARQQVLTTHPALAEAGAQTDRARTSVAHEQALRVPTPTFSGEYERQPDVSYYRFGVNIPLPLWDKRKGPIAEAKAEVNRSEALGRQRRLEIVAALERAYDQYQISNQQVHGLEAGSLREASAAVEAARSAYKFGERGIVEVLDAQRVLQGVRSDLLEARFARQSALIDLEELGVTPQ